MASITTWMRLEPVSRNVEMKASLQARIYDPLWLLARQWQLGEFEGEDNGSPIFASWRGEGARITRYHSGPVAPRESVRLPQAQATKPERLKLVVESGLEFLRIVDQMSEDGMTNRNYRDDFIR